MKSKVKIQAQGLDGLKEEMEIFAKKSISYAASKVADDLSKKTLDIINLFYDHYRPYHNEPIRYKRHYDNLRENSFERYYSNAHGNKAIGGICLTPEAMEDIYKPRWNKATQDYTASFSPQMVFYEAIFEGMHGDVTQFPNFEGYVPPIMNPTPLDLIGEAWEEVCDNLDKYMEEGKEKARKLNYTYLKF